MTERKRISFKYRAGPAALRSLSDGMAYFAGPGELNDSLEAKFTMAGPETYATKLSEVLTQLAQEKGAPYRFEPDPAHEEQVKQELAAESAAFSKNCQRLGIYSCTTRPDNQPMWAYYCNDSRGICLELEWPDDLVKEYELLPTFVSYSASPPPPRQVRRHAAGHPGACKGAPHLDSRRTAEAFSHAGVHQKLDDPINGPRRINQTPRLGA